MPRSAVHLVGNYINQDTYESDSNSEFEGEDEFSGLEEDDGELDEEIKGQVLCSFRCCF